MLVHWSTPIFIIAMQRRRRSEALGRKRAGVHSGYAQNSRPEGQFLRRQGGIPTEQSVQGPSLWAQALLGTGDVQPSCQPNSTEFGAAGNDRAAILGSRQRS